jgi:hypothetical protein
LVDKTGKWIVKPKFQDSIVFSDGMGLVTTGSGYGFIDKTGTIVIQPQFVTAMDFTQGLAVASYEAVTDSGIAPLD